MKRFAVAAGFRSFGGQPAFNVFTVSRHKKPIVSQGFIDVIPDYTIETSPRPDILILPGGSSRTVIADPAFMAWVESMSQSASTTLTVCTGAFIAGRAGLLEGLEATTWYDAVPRLAKQFPNTRVQPGRRYVDSGESSPRQAFPRGSTDRFIWSRERWGDSWPIEPPSTWSTDGLLRRTSPDGIRS